MEACRLTGGQAESMSSLARVVNCVVCVCVRGHMGPGGTGSRLGVPPCCPRSPTQTPLTTHRHGNQGAQEGDAGWAEGV